MTQYAYFDVTKPSPQLVLGWYDTGAFNYTNLPAAPDLLELSPTQWANRLSGTWAIENGTLVPYTPAVPTLTLGQRAVALMLGGLAVTSSGDNSLDATYACDPTSQQQVSAEIISILLNSTFTDGETTIEWPDITSQPGALSVHEFSIGQFKDLASAIAAFVTGCIRCINGKSSSLPIASTTIP